MSLYGTFEDNRYQLDVIFQNCADIVQKEILLQYPNQRRAKIYFVEEAVNDITLRKVIWGMSDVEELSDLAQIEKTILSGNAVLIVEDSSAHSGIFHGRGGERLSGCRALKVRGKGYPGIGVTETRDEQVVRGSNEGFSVSYKTNEVLVRKRIRSAMLKVEELQAGIHSDTGIAIMYMDNIVRKEILSEIKKRLDGFQIDGFMDSGVVEQLTDGEKWSIFPQYMTTVRPDRAAQFLLDGHIVLLVDNSPVALVLPVNFGSFMKTADDYYERWGIATFLRSIRYLAIFFAISLPALYISIVNFHPEILPNNLVLVFIEARENIPYPVFIEVMIMEISFELIREAGVRVPGAMGNAIGVVGGLIVGSAAVDASLASPIIVIIVALTAMCSFAIPNNEFSSSFRIIKYFLIIMAEIYGIFGYIAGILLIMLHLSGLKSFGFPYLGPAAGAELNHSEDKKDFILRTPYRFLTKRPIFSREDNRTKLLFKRK